MANTDSIGSSCVFCANSLTGLQRMYCSARCKQYGWRTTNPENVAAFRARDLVKKQAKVVAATPARIAECKDCNRQCAEGLRRSRRCSECARARGVIALQKWHQLRSTAKHAQTARVVVCQECKAEFCPLYGHSHTTLCAPCLPISRVKAKRCHKAKRRALKRGSTAENVDPFKVFDRDNWRCQLCGSKTPIAKRGTYERLAPELDHIIPLSLGGTHTYINTQCACRECNGKKSNRPMGQMLLIG